MNNSKKLTKPQMRVAIAKDVLAQIKAKRFKIINATYWKVKGANDSQRINQDFLIEKKPVCKVCALGSAVISGIKLFNEVETSDNSGNDGETTKILGKWFSESQMALIEDAFEGPYDSNTCLLSDNNPNEEAVAFGCQFPNRTDRAVAIFKNVIKNNGVFRPA